MKQVLGLIVSTFIKIYQSCQRHSWLLQTEVVGNVFWTKCAEQCSVCTEDGDEDEDPIQNIKGPPPGGPKNHLSLTFQGSSHKKYPLTAIFRFDFKVNVSKEPLFWGVGGVSLTYPEIGPLVEKCLSQHIMLALTSLLHKQGSLKRNLNMAVILPS